MHFNVCNIFLKPWNIIRSLFKASVAIKIKKMFEEEESIEIVKFLGSVTNIENYQKITNQVWRKYKSII